MAYRKDEARQDLLVSLGEWGVHSGKSNAHSVFVQRCHEKVDDCFRVTRSQKDQPDFTSVKRFPADVSTAVEHIFEMEFSTELKEDMMFEVVDNLEKLTAPHMKAKVREMAPYRQWKTRHPRCHNTSLRGLSFQLRPEFKGFRSADLDPLIRFDYKYYANQKEYHEDLLCGFGSLHGIAFEGIVASHATNHIACQNCFARSLVWCGGGEGPWKDLVCKGCHSTYEIKSKQSMEAIEKVFHFESAWGGSFTGFHFMTKEMRGKHYILFVCRTPTYDVKTGARVWPVFSAEIERVAPNLTSSAFRGIRDKNSRFSINSKVILKKGSRKRWFKVPYVEIDIDKVATRAFKRVYGDEDRKKIDEAGATRTAIPIAPSKTVEQLRKELDIWKLYESGDEDDVWEAY